LQCGYVLFTLALAVSALATPENGSQRSLDVDAVEFPDLFEGPERTLSLKFEAGEIDGGSLRAIPRAKLEAVLVYAQCEILSAIETATPKVPYWGVMEENTSAEGLTG